MWVPPEQLRQLATSLRAAHGHLVERGPDTAAAVVAARWECGAGDELRRQVSVLVRRVDDASHLLASCASATDHVATEADALLAAMRREHDETERELRRQLREAIADGRPTGHLRAELDGLPGVPDTAWLGAVPAPTPPTVRLAPASALLPPVESPAGRFLVEIDQLDRVPAALESLSLGVTLARLAQGRAEDTDLRGTDDYALGGSRVADPVEDAFGLTGLAFVGVQLDGLAEQARVAAARVRRVNGDQAALLAQFGDATGFSQIAGQLLDLRIHAAQPGLDLAEVTAMLELARDAGLDPGDYAEVLRTYWFLDAADAAGIDVASWNIDEGAFANADSIEAVYAYYGRLFIDHPEMQWAGLANMVGGGFAAAFYDLDLFGQVADGVSRVPGSPLRQGLGQLSESELHYYETTFLSMQRQIFEDIGGMHQAFAEGGMANLEEMRAAGLVDPRTFQAFQDMDTYSRMDPDDPAAQRLISSANLSLAYREQGAVIGDEYDEMREHLPSGQAFTYVAGLVGAPSVPGAQSPAQYDPLHVRVPVADVDLGLPDVPLVHVPFWDDAHVDVATVEADVTTPLPRTNVSVFEDRMDLLENDTLPAYERLLREQGRDGMISSGLISADPAVVSQHIEDNRLQHRLDDVLAQLADWDVDVDARVGG